MLTQPPMQQWPLAGDLDGKMDIHVALDSNDIEEAARFLDLLRTSSVKVFEYGAPLVSNFGVSGFRHLRTVDTRTTYVDAKTMDFPNLEWDRYIDAGASEVTGMLFASDSVVEDMAALQVAGRVKVCVSCMGYPLSDLTRRVTYFVECGLNTFVAHAADRVRAAAFDVVVSQLELLQAIPGITIYAGGGIGPENVRRLLRFPVQRIIVGRALSTAADPASELHSLIRSCAR